MNLLLDTSGRRKVSYWKLRQENSLANIGVFGSTQLVNVKVYVSLEDPGMLSHYCQHLFSLILFGLQVLSLSPLGDSSIFLHFLIFFVLCSCRLLYTWTWHLFDKYTYGRLINTSGFIVLVENFDCIYFPVLVIISRSGTSISIMNMLCSYLGRTCFTLFSQWCSVMYVKEA